MGATRNGDDLDCRVLLAIVRGASTMPEIQAATGREKPTVYTSMLRLRSRGLIAWEARGKGTIHALVHEVPFSAPRSVPS